MKRPSKRTIRKFLDVVDRLDHFEVTQRHLRGIGALGDTPLPVPEVVETIAWLKHISNPNVRVSDHG